MTKKPAESVAQAIASNRPTNEEAGSAMPVSHSSRTTLLKDQYRAMLVPPVEDRDRDDPLVGLRVTHSTVRLAPLCGCEKEKQMQRFESGSKLRLFSTLFSIFFLLQFSEVPPHLF